MKTWSTLTGTSDNHPVKHLKYPPILSLAETATSIIFAATKVLSRQKHVFVVTKHIFCCDKCTLAVTIFVAIFVCVFVATKLLLQQIFVVTNIILSWPNVCHDKHTFVTTHVCHDKTRLLSQQKYACQNKAFCHDKHLLVTTNVCCDKCYVTPSILLSRQKTCFDVTNTCL